MNSAAIAKSAAASIRKNGKRYAITRRTKSFNTAGEVSATVTKNGNITAVRLPAKSGKMGFDQVHEPEDLKKQQVTFLLAGVDSFAPELLDEVNLDGEAFIVRGIAKLQPAGVNIIYKLGLVRA